MQSIYKTFGNDAVSEPRVLEFVGTVCAPLAARMLSQIGLDERTTNPFKLLDNGAGLGPVASEVQKRISRQVLSRSNVISADFSESTVHFVEKRIEKEGWINTQAMVVDAQVYMPSLLQIQLSDTDPRSLASQTKNSAM